MKKKRFLLVLLAYYGFITYRIYSGSVEATLYIDKLPLLPAWDSLAEINKYVLMGVYGLAALLALVVMMGLKPTGVINTIFNIVLFSLLALYAFEMYNVIVPELSTPENIDYFYGFMIGIGLISPLILMFKKRRIK